MKEKKLYEEKLAANGFADSDLTAAERKALLQEVRAELNGSIVIDGVLDNKPRYSIKENHGGSARGA